MNEIVNIMELIEPTEAERKIISNYIVNHGLTQFLDEYDSLDLSVEVKEKIEAIKTILDATSI